MSVKVFDVSFRRVNRLPESGARMVRIRSIFAGESFVLAHLLQPWTTPKHSHCSKKQKEAIQRICQTFSEFYPLSYANWEGAFFREKNMNKSIVYWTCLTEKYLELTSNEYNQPEQKEDVFIILLEFISDDPVEKEIQKHMNVVTPNQVSEILEEFSESIAEWEYQYFPEEIEEMNESYKEMANG